MFLDEIEKIKHYKEKIAKMLILIENKAEAIHIDKKLKDIDSRLAIFQFIQEKEKSLVNVNKFNQDLENIYQDLLILYRLCYEFSAKKFEELYQYAQTHLSALEEEAASCHRKSEYETNSTTLGKTIHFQTSDFEMTTANNNATINLGSITTNEGAKLAFLCEGDNFSDENVEFIVGDKVVTNFRVQRDYLKVDGKNNIKKYAYVNNSSITPVYMQEMKVEELKPKKENIYLLYGGRNSIRQNKPTSTLLIESENLLSKNIVIKDRCQIEFYVLESTYISINYNKEPIYKNFTGNQIKNPARSQKIVIECDADFIFSIVTNGTVFAEKQLGFVKDDKLFYPTPEKFNMFFIEEYSEGAKVQIPVTVIIKNLTEPRPKIKHIAVKQLTAYDEVHKL